MTEKSNHLSFLSGLKVVSKIPSVTEFLFYHENGNVIKSCLGYPKAKHFAEGINCGRMLKLRHF